MDKSKDTKSKPIRIMGLFRDTKVHVFATFCFKARGRTERGDTSQRA